MNWGLAIGSLVIVIPTVLSVSLTNVYEEEERNLGRGETEELMVMGELKKPSLKE